jgi:hypothetical protein
LATAILIQLEVITPKPEDPRAPIEWLQIVAMVERRRGVRNRCMWMKMILLAMKTVRAIRDFAQRLLKYANRYVESIVTKQFIPVVQSTSRLMTNDIGKCMWMKMILLAMKTVRAIRDFAQRYAGVAGWPEAPNI